MIIERACSIPAPNALPRVAAWFQQNGYDLVAKSPQEMSLFNKVGHRLSIRGDGSIVRFEFSDDSPEYERRADAAMQGLTGLPTAAASKRCPTCSTMAEPGAAECAVCGTAL